MRLEQRTFETIDALKRSTTLDALFAVLSEGVAPLGFSSFLVTDVPLPGETLKSQVVLSGWPPGWLSQYSDQNYAHEDVVVRRIKSSCRPFRWSEASQGRPLRPIEARIMGEATEFGMLDGFCVPVHGVTGYQACVSFGGNRVDLTGREASALQLIGLIAYGEARARRLRHGNAEVVEDAGLTAREVEVLRWISRGKSNWDVSVILGISERTIEKHVAAASVKLNTCNRAHAVAESIRLGVIH